MVRPRHCRRISGNPGSRRFKPAGIPARELEETIVSLDEFEAIRLADHEGLYQEQAAEKMGVSRQTFGRIIESARKKIAHVLVNGTCLSIEGGTIEAEEEARHFTCKACGYRWDVAFGLSRPEQCPKCKLTEVKREQ